MELVTQTHIRGSFRGWRSHNVYELENGDRWRQTGQEYDYEYSYAPAAVIWKDGSKYFLEVAGMHTKIEVERD